VMLPIHTTSYLCHAAVTRCTRHAAVTRCTRHAGRRYEEMERERAMLRGGMDRFKAEVEAMAVQHQVGRGGGCAGGGGGAALQ